MKKYFILFVLINIYFLGFGQIPAGYYDSATGSGYTLKTQLSNIIDGHTVISYGALYNAYKTTDNILIVGNSKVYDMYSIKADGSANYYYYHSSIDQCGNYSIEGDCYNREHSASKLV